MRISTNAVFIKPPCHPYADMAEHNPPKYILAAGGACRKVRKVTTENNVSRFQTAIP
ncbi:hypothetical protein [Neisseria gonorrhoeae]|uniref:hypothetical protein n=1 Tax=Neisseria gonorrhoeae TaxID=485 RepID=UPI0027D95418|nr:hypothetical protein [Neisseria gonorrhoeae]